MSHGALLEKLATDAGILSEYYDIWGHPRRVSEAARRSLLVEMGFRVGTAADLDRELEALEAGPWRRVLPPVVVARVPVTGLRIPLVLPESQQFTSFTLRFRHENGRIERREFQPGNLPGGETRDLRRARVVRREVAVPEDAEPGYHRLELLGPDLSVVASLSFIVTPGVCYLPPALARGERFWGPAAQLYGVRSGRNWGMGDFSDLDDLVRLAAKGGAGLVGVNPLHALFPAVPGLASPYSPSSRMFVNPLYLDVEAVPEFAECLPARRRVESSDFRFRALALRGMERIEYAEVAAVKLELLELLYGYFRSHHLEPRTARGSEFRAFVEAGGEGLESFSVFESLDEHFRRLGCDGWRAWPPEYRQPDSPAVIRFAKDHRERVEWFQYLQWECDRQLGRVARNARNEHLPIGLYQDLAVGVDRNGYETWFRGGLHAPGAALGAPPDDFNLMGQDWGLAPWIPSRLREAGYRPFIDSLRATMRHAGAVRIDHVMGLSRAFWIPSGSPPTEGAYVRYPFQDLLGIVALESVRNRCVVVGEDLGTVPDEVRNALGPAGILSYRLLVFQKRGDGSFLAPGDYPRQSLVAITTHDLPTLSGWWRGRDIALRSELRLFPDDAMRERLAGERARDRFRLLEALQGEALLPGTLGPDPAGPDSTMTGDLALAVHRYAASAPSMLLSVQLEDVLGVEDQANLPGTVTEHPNWLRKLPLELDAIARDPRFLELVSALNAARGEAQK